MNNYSSIKSRIVAIVFLVLVLGFSWYLYKNKYKADVVPAKLAFSENFDKPNSRSTVSDGSFTNTRVEIVTDSEALSGTSVLKVNAFDKNPTTRAQMNVTTPLGQTLKYPLYNTKTNQDINFDFALKGEIKGTGLDSTLGYTERSCWTVWLVGTRCENFNKTITKTILPSQINKENWTVIHNTFNVATKNRLIDGSVYFIPVSEQKNTVFTGSIDSLNGYNDDIRFFKDSVATKYTDGYVLTTIPLNAEIDRPLQNLEVSGTGKTNAMDSNIQIVLKDKNNIEYLVYRNNGVLTPAGTFDFKEVSEETALLENIYPKELLVYSFNTDWQINSVNLVLKPEKIDQTLKDQITKIVQVNAVNEQNAKQMVREDIKRQYDTVRIDQISKWSKKQGSDATFESNEKTLLNYGQYKLAFGGSGIFDPYEGILHSYKEGILKTNFEYSIKKNVLGFKVTFVILKDKFPTVSDSFPTTFDWTNRGGEKGFRNDYIAGKTTGVNWVTPVKDQSGCGSCYAHAAVAAIESKINLWYNQHIDANLSEQQAMCESSGCNGWIPGPVINHYKDKPLNLAYNDETTKNDTSDNLYNYNFRYRKTDSKEACDLPKAIQGWKTKDSGTLAPYENTFNYLYQIGKAIYTGSMAGTDDATIKKTLIQKGPMAISIPPFEHSVLLVGWDVSTIDGVKQTVWKFKNSWGGKWGTNLAGRHVGSEIVEISKPVFTPEISCKKGYSLLYYKINSSSWVKGVNTYYSTKCVDDNNPNSTAINSYSLGDTLKNVSSYMDLPIGYDWCEVYPKVTGNLNSAWKKECFKLSDLSTNGYFYSTLGLNARGPVDYVGGVEPVGLSKQYAAVCEDKDDDGYFYWGMGQQPASCASIGAPAVEDCDDYSPIVGPAGTDGVCQKNLPGIDTITYAAGARGGMSNFNVNVIVPNLVKDYTWRIMDTKGKVLNSKTEKLTVGSNMFLKSAPIKRGAVISWNGLDSTNKALVAGKYKFDICANLKNGNQNCNGIDFNLVVRR